MNSNTTARPHRTDTEIDSLVLSRQQSPGFAPVVFDAIVNLASKMSYMHPGSNPSLYGVHVERNIPYTGTGMREHTLDIYRPENPPAGPMPIVLYVHGGGFRLLSKESHWMMAVAFARRGYLVLNMNYRLAPKHPFPAALEDVNSAWLWLLDNAKRLGGDLDRIVVAGESAGANLVASLAIETSYRRPEPFARAVFDRGVQPKAVMAACGIFQVSDIERLLPRTRSLPLVADWLVDMRNAYLGRFYDETKPEIELADPVSILERGVRPDRPLPAFFLPVGGGDVLVEDTLRMDSALKRLGASAEASVYGDEPHAFHMLTWKRESKRLWNDTFRFLSPHLTVSGGRSGAVMPLRPRRRRSWLEERIITAMAA